MSSVTQGKNRQGSSDHAIHREAVTSGNQLIRTALGKQRVVLFRAHALAGCLRLVLDEHQVPDKGEPDLSYVARTLEDLLKSVIDGLDPTTLGL